jgi:hypothetical protein
MHLTPTAPLGTGTAVQLPTDLQVGTATLAIEQRTSGIGARAGYVSPADYTPIWGDRDASDSLTGWKLAGATGIEQALAATRGLVHASSIVEPLPEDHGPATVERRVTPLALLQAADGAWYATRLHDTPTAGGYVERHVTASWSEDSPARQRPTDFGGVRFLNPLPSLRAIVSEDVYWLATVAPAAPSRF